MSTWVRIFICALFIFNFYFFNLIFSAKKVMSWNFLMLKNHWPPADVEKGGESKEILMSATGTVFEGSNVYVSSIVCGPKMII